MSQIIVKNTVSRTVEESLKIFPDADPHEFQNVISFFPCPQIYLEKLSRRFVKWFSRKVANRQTDAEYYIISLAEVTMLYTLYVRFLFKFCGCCQTLCLCRGCCHHLHRTPSNPLFYLRN